MMKTVIALALMSLCSTIAFGAEPLAWPKAVIAAFQKTHRTDGIKVEVLRPSVLLVTQGKFHLIRLERTASRDVFLANTRTLDMHVIKTRRELRKAIAAALPKIALQRSLWMSYANAADETTDPNSAFLTAVGALIAATHQGDTCTAYSNFIDTCLVDAAEILKAINASQSKTDANKTQLIEALRRLALAGEGLSNGTDAILSDQSHQDFIHQCSCAKDGFDPQCHADVDVPGSLVKGLAQCTDSFNQMKTSVEGSIDQQTIDALKAIFGQLTTDSRSSHVAPGTNAPGARAQ